MLGLVDDIIGVTDSGFKAQQMNVLFNVKTAEKRLQFGEKKCKSMLISTKNEVLNSPLMVDKWAVTHVENPASGDSDLVDTYEGLVEMEKTTTYKYLGFMISSRGDNLVNINEMRNKSIWIIRKIMNRLNGLSLKKYYFECALIFSILYALETYYNLKETEVRQIDRIEECFLRKILKTTKGCPIAQMYLETGHVTARLEIKKIASSSYSIF